MRRNTALRCGNLRSFTLSKLPQVILARLVLLAFSYGYKIRFKKIKKGAGIVLPPLANYK